VNFYRIFDNKLYTCGNVEKLGFPISNPFYIPDEYLNENVFTICRTCFGIGDWGILSAIPRLLKEKYPNCKVYIPSKKFIKNVLRSDSNASEIIFKNNLYVDKFKDYLLGEIYHDHYRIYDDNDLNIPLIKQILLFWQFNESEYTDYLPELYFNDYEKELGDYIIDKFVGKEKYGCLLLSDRVGTQNGKFDTESHDNDFKKIDIFLQNNNLPYFYWSYKPLKDIEFNYINPVFDLRNVNMRVQLYIRSKAELNIGNQCGVLDCLSRYTKVYSVQRQFPLKHNFIEGINYL